jgi:large subunit ribosomal protein L6
MSRIGKVPVALPGGVSATVEGSVLSVKGPKGTLTMPMLDDISYGIEDGRIVVRPANETKRARSFWGCTARSCRIWSPG